MLSGSWLPRTPVCGGLTRGGHQLTDDHRAAAAGGFSVDGSVRIEAADRAGHQRLVRYCARPPFA